MSTISPTSCPLALRLLGVIDVRVHGVPLPRLRSRKGQWLLALLALRAGREMERLSLVATLWPESAAAPALANLRSSLKDLRQALGEEASRLHSPTASTLALDLSGAEVDVLLFDKAIERGDPTSLEQAVALYRGPLLDGCTEEWALQEREAREQAHLMALETLADHALVHHNPAAAERFLRRAVATDPFRESAQRALMRALADGGNPAAALLAYRELCLLLRRELNTEPDPETAALFQSLRSCTKQAALGAHRSALGWNGDRAATHLVPIPSGQAPSAMRQALPVPGLERSRVVLLYKRNAQPDTALLALLESRLTARGCQVFVDRHLTIGMEWAREIERQVRTADAVVPLLSAASVRSEMLAYEVQIAHEAARQHLGRPRLLPVRVHDPGPLPEPLAAILNPIEHALWEGPQDDERLVADLVRALENGSAPPAAVSWEWLEPVGGAVPLDSAFYVVRSVDEEFRAAIARRDSIVLVKGARQMGKTSLLARGLHQARRAGARVARTDFQMLDSVHLETADAFFRRLADSIADQLDLEVAPEEIWEERRGPGENFKRYWQRVALRVIKAPLVWGLDEVDRLFSCDFAASVFALFRSWHNERALDPDGPWHRLTLAIAYATEAHLFITDIHQSPFNVGTRLTLRDFTVEQIADLNERYGFPLRSEAEITRFAGLVGGHPYLVRRGLHEMVVQDVDLAAIEAEADGDEGIFGDHLRRMLVLLVRNPELCEAVREVVRGKPCPAPDSFYRLRGAGVFVGPSAEDARLRCQLYHRYLERFLR
jgi:DNA-binding SARP family transcriptional activator